MSSSSDPLVTIITPSFNQGQFLGDCLASVAAQDYPCIEHVVQDGESTDGSLELLRATRAPVVWKSEPDGGQADAVNRAFIKSRGPIVGWINSDDALLATDTVSSVVTAFAKYPDVDVIFGDAALMSAEGRLLRHFRPPATNWRKLPYGWSPINQPAAYLRRSALRDGELPLNEDLHLTLDLELWLRLRGRGSRFLHLPRALAADRDHAERKVHTIAKRYQGEWAWLESEYDVSFSRSPRLARILGFAARIRGVPSVLAWERRYRPAFPWSVDSRRQRLVRQVFRSHASQIAAARGTDRG